jgi:hypothetical protein
LADTFVNLNCVVEIYADDTKLYCSYELGDLSPVLVKAIDQLVEWAKIGQLRMADSKCIAHRVSNIATSISCENAIDGYKLQWSNCTGDLGVRMDTDLKFTQRISKFVHIAHSRAALILICFSDNIPVVLVRGSCTYVRLILEYCTPV